MTLGKVDRADDAWCGRNCDNSMIDKEVSTAWDITRNLDVLTGISIPKFPTGQAPTAFAQTHVAPSVDRHDWPFSARLRLFSIVNQVVVGRAVCGCGPLSEHRLAPNKIATVSPRQGLDQGNPRVSRAEGLGGQ
jgi:hypothetical protein